MVVFILSTWSQMVTESLPASYISTGLWYTVLLLLLGALYWYGFGKFRTFDKEGISGPKPLPFIGHIKDFIKYKFHLHILFADYCKKYGDCFGMYFQGVPSLVISDSSMLKQILIKDFSKFHDRKISFELPEPFDSFMTIVQGERWKFIRNTLTPSFTSGKMRPMSQLMNKISDTMVMKFKAAADKGEIIDVVRCQQSLTLEAILSAAFGIEAQTQTDPNDKLTAMARFAMTQPKWIALLSLIPGASKFFKYLPYGFTYYMNPIMKVTKDIIKQRRLHGFHGKKKDILQLMLDAQDEPDRNGRRLTDDEVLAQALVFLLAGYETSSTTLALTCYFLAANQDVQERLYKEISEALPSKDDVPDYDLVQRLEYLDMVLSETLRLYPPGAMLLRTCNEDCEINGFPIKNNWNVIVPVYWLHRNPKYWQDAEKFTPERFSAQAKAERDPMTYMPFGHGPRNCIGMRFAQLEMKIVLARLVKEFKLETCEKTVMPPKVALASTLTVRDPIDLKITRRDLD